MITLSPQWALLAGMALAIILKDSHPLHKKAKAWSGKLLQASVILLGSALNFHAVINQGAQGVGVTFVSISLVFLLGFLFMKLFRVEKILGTLITMGTAICGGSAIGALAPVLNASTSTIAISIGIVFLLNSASVFIFPGIGHYFALTQEQFGLWSALAIHDTSAVVASASSYGKEALTIATTIKLTRALWIIPITLIFGAFTARTEKKVTIPWFIAGFLGFSLLFTFVDELSNFREPLLYLSKQGFAITLFLIGVTFNLTQIKSVGARPFFFGAGLWIIVSIGSLFYVKFSL